jgi:hypothetical protein
LDADEPAAHTARARRGDRSALEGRGDRAAVHRGELVEAALLDAHGESRVLTGLLGVMLFGWIALRRRATEIALCGFAFVAVAQGVIGNNFLFDASNVPFVAVLFLLYSAGRYLGAGGSGPCSPSSPVRSSRASPCPTRGSP